MLVLAAAITAAVYHAGISLEVNTQKVNKRSPLWRLPRFLAAPADDTLLMPVQGVSVRRMTDTWLAPRSGGRQHKGQDIFAPRGTPVRSATEGIVTHVGENDLGGKVVFILGAGGRTYYYAHLDRHEEDLSAGDLVTTNAVIGYVGNTGNARATSPHLHFAIFGTDGAINPLPLLRDREVGAKGRGET